MFKNKVCRLFLSFCLVMTSIVCLSSCTNEEPIIHSIEQLCPYCNKCNDDSHNCEDKCDCEPLVVTKEQFKMYENTIWETPAYLFKTNKEGPGIVIIGGIHGDEIAGWSAPLELINTIEGERKLCGNILIVPQVNIQADLKGQRFVGYTINKDPNFIEVTINGVTDSYSDLNRSFINGRYSSATNRTIWLSDGIVEVVKDFDEQFGADYIIDLHEARKSWTQTRDTGTNPTNASLGDMLIYDNKPLVCRKIISNYNKNYRLEDEPYFASEGAKQNGSFSKNMTELYPNSVVFTVETNRDLYYNSSSGTYENKIDLSVRVRQQLNMLSSMFDVAWGRI